MACRPMRSAPHAFENEEGEIIVHFLDLLNLAGYQRAYAGQYMRLCHARARLPGPQALRALGHRPGTRSEQIERRTRR